MYAIASLPTPLFNTVFSPFSKPKLERDSQGRILEMETIAFPGTKFHVLQQHETVWEVQTSEYPSSKPLYVDARFLQLTQDEPKEREKLLPSIHEILSRMEKLIGVRYFWGGNWPEGIPHMRHLYPHHETQCPDVICQGIDCSGLLFYTANGVTPRNTKELSQFGVEVKTLQPLDMIVWPGHVLFVLDDQTLIESLIGYGVITSPLESRLEEVQRLTLQNQKKLSFRRWHPEAG